MYDTLHDDVLFQVPTFIISSLERYDVPCDSGNVVHSAHGGKVPV